MNISTFAHPDLGFDGIVDLLTGTGLTFGAPRRSTRSLLDTFDGRLHAAGLRLELDADGARHLTLFDDASVPASVASENVPRFAADLPGGPFGARLRSLLDVRALQPIATFDDTSATAIVRNSEGKTISSVVVHAAVVLPGTAGLAPVVEVVEAAGHQDPAQRICAELAALGFAETDDLVSLVLGANGVDPAGFTSEPTVPLDAASPAGTGFRAVLANLADTIQANWQGTIDDIDTEFLHELRVAVRRTRSVIGQAKRVLPEHVRGQFRDDFAWLAAATGPTRDLDVYALEWPSYIAGMSSANEAALEPVRRHIENHRLQARADLVEVLQSRRAADVMAAWRAALATQPPEQPSEAAAPIGRAVAKRFRQAHDKVLHQGRLIDADSPAEHLHDLRKDAKKLRYLVECFASVMPGKLRKSFVKQLKGLQDNLGEHQDAEVHAAELNVVAGELDAEHATTETLLALGQLTERLEQSQREARAEFAERFAAYDSAATAAIVDDLLDTLSSA